MKSYGLNKIESVSEVDKMKKERGFVGLGLALVINYMMHQMAGPAIYFGVVLCGLIIIATKLKRPIPMTNPPTQPSIIQGLLMS